MEKTEKVGEQAREAIEQALFAIRHAIAHLECWLNWYADGGVVEGTPFAKKEGGKHGDCQTDSQASGGGSQAEVS